MELEATSTQELIDHNKDFRYEDLELYLLSNIGLMRLNVGSNIENELFDTKSLEELLYKIAHYTIYYPTKNQKGDFVCNRVDYRSIGDLFLLAKNYRPTTTIREMYDCLIKLIYNNKIGCWLCNGARKVMYLFNRRNGFINIGTPEAEDEYGFIFGKSKICKDAYIGVDIEKIIF